MNVALSASRVARRYASLRSAGLFDRDLVMKAVNHVMTQEVDDEERVYAFEYDPRTSIKTKTSKELFEWDDDEESGEVYIPVKAPVGAAIYMDFVLPAKLVMQVPTAQRGEFMLEVLNLVFHKLKPAGVITGVMGGVSLLRDTLLEDNESGLDFKVSGVDSRARISAPEQAGRFVVKGNLAQLPVKFNATYEVDWEWGDDTDIRDYLPEPPEPDDYFDDSDYGPYGYSPY